MPGPGSVRSQPAPASRSAVSTARGAAFLLASFPLGAAYFAGLVAALSVGVATLPVGVGLLVLAGTAAAARRLAAVDAALTGALLDREPRRPPDAPRPSDTGLFAAAKAELLHAPSWRAVLALLLRFPVGVGGVVLLTTLGATSLALLAAPLYYGHPDAALRVTDVLVVDTLPGALLASLAGGLLAAVSLPAVTAAARFAVSLTDLVTGRR